MSEGEADYRRHRLGQMGLWANDQILSSTSFILSGPDLHFKIASLSNCLYYVRFIPNNKLYFYQITYTPNLFYSDCTGSDSNILRAWNTSSGCQASYKKRLKTPTG